MPAATTSRRRVPRWLGNPIASAILAGVLALDLTLLVRGGSEGSLPSFVSSYFQSRSTQSGILAGILAVRDETGMRLIDPEVESWDELSALLDRGEPVLSFVFARTERRIGFWVPTSEHFYRGVRHYTLSGDWTESQVRRAKALLHDAAESKPERHWLVYARDVIDAPERSRRILWPGVARSAFAATLALGLILSILGWPAWFARRPWSRRRRRLERGQCPGCGYDLRGVESPRCPECGGPAPKGG
jgi:hypothetical protein